MSVCHIGESVVVAADAVYERFIKVAPKGLKIIRAGKGQQKSYPEDVGLNVCILGNKLIHNLKLTDPSVLSEADKFLIEKIYVNQGYTKCSVCVLKCDRIITGDRGIHLAALKLGIKSLLISSGFIELPGYNTGFIGGCCGKLSELSICFTGKLTKHPDEKEILKFIEDAGLEIIYLTDDPVFDVGSIIPIEEY
jgi:hypothetical protein